VKVTRRRGYRINLGNYEHVELEASVEAEIDDVLWEDRLPGIEQVLDRSLLDDLRTAQELSVNDNSLIKVLDLS
jgi:hypothetical protein